MVLFLPTLLQLVSSSSQGTWHGVETKKTSAAGSMEETTQADRGSAKTLIRVPKPTTSRCILVPLSPDIEKLGGG